LKVHMLIDALQDVGKFVKITAAKVHDSKFLNDLSLNPHSMVVFDKAYNHYKLFTKWTEKQKWFVTRMKDNAMYEIVKTVSENTLSEDVAGVLKEEHIALFYKENKQDKEPKKLLLRRITYQDEKGRKYVFITNNMLLINDYNNFCRAKWVRNSLRIYIKAFNHKIIPIFLTIISTVLGLVPFVWSGQKKVFWFAFAAGSMGGLIFSIVAVVIYLPLFLKLSK